MSVRALRRGSIAASRVVAAAGPVTALSLTGAAGNYASTPDTVANSITGDIDIRVKASLVDWTPTAFHCLIDKVANNQSSYGLYVEGGSTGKLYFVTSLTSTGENPAQSTALGFTDGTARWVRATRVAASGEVKFYTSTDGSTWTQHGATTSNTAGNIFNSTQQLRVGLTGWPDSPLNGTMYHAEVRSGIDGTVAVKFDPSAVTILGTRNPTSFVSSTGETWTLTGSAWNWVTI